MGPLVAFAAQAAALQGCRLVCRRAENVVELGALAVSPLIGRWPLLGVLHGPVLFLRACRTIKHLAGRGRRGKDASRQSANAAHNSTGQATSLQQGQDHGNAGSHHSGHQRHPSARMLAGRLTAQVTDLKARLAALQLYPLPQGMETDGHDLERFLMASGALEAKSKQDTEKAIRKAVQLVQDIASLRSSLGLDRLWQDNAFLARWSSVVWWAKAGPAWCICVDAQQTSKLCKSAADFESCSLATLAMIEWGIRNLMAAESPGAPASSDRVHLCVFVGGSAMGVLRIAGPLKHLCSILAKIHPERLDRAYIADLPMAIKLPALAVLAVVHPETRKKFCFMGSKALPPELRAAQGTCLPGLWSTSQQVYAGSGSGEGGIKAGGRWAVGAFGRAGDGGGMAQAESVHAMRLVMAVLAFLCLLLSPMAASQGALVTT